MKTYAALLSLTLLACSGGEPTSPTPPTDAGAEASTDAGTIDRYWYACCSFADEGFSEYRTCCDAWRDAGSPMTEYR